LTTITTTPPPVPPYHKSLFLATGFVSSWETTKHKLQEPGSSTTTATATTSYFSH